MFFFNFEGMDGAGKSTTMKHVYEKLSKRSNIRYDFDIYLSKEPGQTEAGRQIRKLLLDKETDLSPETIYYLYLADRAEHYNKFLKPLLDRDDVIVLNDRYCESTWAYQVMTSDRIKPAINIANHRVATESLYPDKTYLFLCSESHRKKEDNCDRFDSASDNFKRQVSDNYKFLANNKKYRDYLIGYEDKDSYRLEKIYTDKGYWEKYEDYIVQDIVDHIMMREEIKCVTTEDSYSEEEIHETD